MKMSQAGVWHSLDYICRLVLLLLPMCCVYPLKSTMLQENQRDTGYMCMLDIPASSK